MKNTFLITALFALLISACSSSNSSAPVKETPQVTKTVAIATKVVIPATRTAAPISPSETLAPTTTSTPSVTLFPTVTFRENVVCRQGPDKNYYRVVSLNSGQSSQVQGRNEDGEWLNILTNTPNKSFTCWIPLSSVEKFGEVKDLMVLIASPLPIGPNRVSATKGACGVNKHGTVVLEWSPQASGTGYIVYRNGKNIANVYDSIYIDHDTPGSATPYNYDYLIQAFNSVGVSKVTASIRVTLCD